MSKTDDTPTEQTAETKTESETESTPMIDADLEAALKPGRIDRLVNDSPLEDLLGRPPITEWFEPERDTVIQDFAAVQRAFKHEYAVELDSGSGVVGAIKVRPASMAMYEKDDLLPHIHAFAGVLSTLPDHQRGMLADIPRSVDYTDHHQSAKDHEQRLRATIRSGEIEQAAAQRVLEMEADDDEDVDADPWPLEVQADIAKERATIESFYENTTAKVERFELPHAL